MGQLRRWVALATAMVLALLVLPVVSTEVALAANTVPFTAKFSTNANGAIITVGNNLLTCPASAGNCSSARNGAALDNNGFAMVNLDADNVGSTFNSSSSNLNLPQGSTVLWAGLYWGARLQAGTGGSGGSAATINTMQLRLPGEASYRAVTASTAAHDQFGPNSTSYNAYQRYADVTGLVQQGGNGAYWGANVTAATGLDRYAGWAMSVVYSAPGLPLRNLTVFDGFDVVSQGNPQNIAVSGFQAPQAGTVDAQLTMVAYEGDLAQTGDFTRLNSTQLATAVSPGSNFFDSVNSLNGASVGSRNPVDRNMLGFDIKNLGASGAIPNNATSARFTFSSNGDVYYPGVLGLAINLYAPDFTASSKTVVNVNGNNPARPGDTLQYTLNYVNTGQDPALGVVSEDLLPENTTYVPGSLALVNPVSGAATPVTDGAGDDVGEVDGRTVRVRLGSGATAATGGRMACSGTGCADDGPSRTAYTFQVTLDDAAGGTTVTNLADLDYRTATTGIAATYTTNPASVDVVEQADVSIAKEMSPDPASVGQRVTATLTVRNNGPNRATGVMVSDQIPEGWDRVTATTTQGSCTVGDGAVSCSVGNMPNEATATITMSGTTSPGSTATTLTNVASVTTTAFDPAPANNVSGDTITLNRQADLSITKTPRPASARPGDPVTWTLTVTNAGPSDARNVLINDALDVAGQATVTGATITGGTNPTCTRPTGRAVRCAVATLPAGATATVTVTGVLATNVTADVVTNTARVSSNTPEASTDDNTARATVTVAAPQADVRVTKDGPANVVAGQTITWTATATNFGPSDAAGVVVTDTVPAGVTGIRASTSRGEACTVTGRTVTCPVGALPSAGPGVPGAAVAITVTGTVAPDATGTLENLATSTATTADPATGNNTASADTDVTVEHDLAVAKTANRTTLPGEAPRPVTYTITITNNGPSAARNVGVTDALPPELDLVQPDPVDGCDATVIASGFTCTVPGPIAPGDTAVITVAMQANRVLAGGPDVVQTVQIDAAGDTNSDNNQASWTLSGDPFTDLSVLKSAEPTVTAGRQTTYTFVVTNNNDSEDVAENLAALRPVLDDRLPAGVTFVDAEVTSGGGQDVACEPQAGRDLRCQLSRNLDAGDSVTVVITVAVAADVEAGTDLVNTVAVETANMTTNPDNNLANNTSEATSTVEAIADVAVTELTLDPVDPASTGPGSQRNVHITLANNGPSTARNVTFRVERTVDAFVVDRGDQADYTCTNTAREVVCTIGELAPGRSLDIDYVIQVAPYAGPGSYPETVQVATTTRESTLANNVRVAPIVVGPAVTDLTVTKAPAGTVPNPGEPGDPHDSFVAGGPFAYQFQVAVPAPGTGLADARGVELTDVLPIGFTAQQISTSRGSCTITPAADPSQTGDTLACDLGTVPGWSGAVAPQPTVITVHGVLDPDANNLHGGDEFAEQVENTAVVTTATPLVGGDTQVSDLAAVDIVEIADLQLAKTPDQETVNAGGTIGYTLTVINAGPSGVEHAVITDSLPVGFALDRQQSDCTLPQTTPEDETQAQPQVPDGPGEEFACRVGEVDAGSSVSIHVVARTDATIADGTSTRNTATVGSLANEAVESNNTATADVRVERLTDLAISSSVSTTTPAAGEDITFTGFATNNGPSTADDTSGDTVFPRGFVPVSVDVPFNDCTWSPAPPADPYTAAWQDVSYTLHCVPQTPGARWEPGGAATNVVVMHIPGDTPAGTYTGTSVIRSETPEVILDNNTTTETVYVQHVSDTRIEKTLVQPNPMVAGRPATWRLTVTNDGPSVAENVVISDNVPDNMSYDSARIEGGDACPPPETYDTEDGDTETIIRCRIAELEVGESASALITFDIDAAAGGRELCNEALVGSSSLDPRAGPVGGEDAGNNDDVSCGQVAVPPAADVSVDVAPEETSVRSGDEAEFRAVVRNNGPNPATGVVVTFDIPPGLTDYSGVVVSSSDGTSPEVNCVVSSLICTIGSLAPEQQVTYRIVGTATGEPGSELTIRGSVTLNEPDENPNNNIDAASVTLIGQQPTPGGPTPTPGGPTPTPGGPEPTPGAPGPTPGQPEPPPGQPEPGNPAEPGGPDGPTSSSQDNSVPELPNTGGPPLLVGLLGLLGPVAGAVLVLADRRRKNTGRSGQTEVSP